MLADSWPQFFEIKSSDTLPTFNSGQKLPILFSVTETFTSQVRLSEFMCHKHTNGSLPFYGNLSGQCLNLVLMYLKLLIVI